MRKRASIINLCIKVSEQYLYGDEFRLFYSEKHEEFSDIQNGTIQFCRIFITKLASSGKVRASEN